MKISRDKYQNLSEKENGKKCQHHHECIKILSKQQKEKKVEYRKNYYLTHEK